MSTLGSVAPSPWYRSLTKAQWKALLASNLGWTFDGFEVFALILTVGVALHQLLDPSQYPLTPAYAGAVIAITVFGWGLAAPHRPSWLSSRRYAAGLDNDFVKSLPLLVLRRRNDCNDRLNGTRPD